MSATSSPAVARSTRASRLLWHQVKYEQMAFWLNRVGALFTVGFSVLFLVMLGASAGNAKISYLDNIRLVQYYVPGFVAYGVMSACFTTLATTLVVRRETGLLKRLRLSPLPTRVMLGAVLCSTALVAVLQVVLLLLIGRFGYSVSFPVNWLAFGIVLVVGMASFSAMGIAISSLIPNQETAGPITSVVFFVLLFLSGLWFPLPSNSVLAKISSYFPVRHFIQAVSAPFELQRGTSPWAWGDVLVILLWGVVSMVIALRKFEWSPRRR
ncbi:MAG: ABC transporter permease [Acidimicrobiales bacterium]